MTENWTDFDLFTAWLERGSLDTSSARGRTVEVAADLSIRNITDTFFENGRIFLGVIWGCSYWRFSISLSTDFPVFSSSPFCNREDLPCLELEGKIWFLLSFEDVSFWEKYFTNVSYLFLVWHAVTSSTEAVNMIRHIPTIRRIRKYPPTSPSEESPSSLYLQL